MRVLPRRTSVPHLAGARTHPKEFIGFYQAYSRRVLIFFTRRVLDAEVAMDLTSETFANAYENRAQFRGSTLEEEQGWLFAIARSELTSFWRKGSAEKAAVRRLGVEVPVLTDAEIERIEDLAEVQTIARQLDESMRDLPEEQSSAVRLRVVEELSYEEVAAALGTTPSAARTRVSRGLRAVARSVGEAGQTS